MNDLDPRTLASIKASVSCGCHQTRSADPARIGRWRLCSYHEGYEDALDELSTPDEVDQAAQ